MRIPILLGRSIHGPFLLTRATSTQNFGKCQEVSGILGNDDIVVLGERKIYIGLCILMEMEADHISCGWAVSS